MLSKGGMENDVFIRNIILQDGTGQHTFDEKYEFLASRRFVINASVKYYCWFLKTATAIKIGF